MSDNTKSDKRINAIQKHKGIPVSPQKVNESTVWKRFITWFIPLMNNDNDNPNEEVIKEGTKTKRTIVEAKDAQQVIDLATDFEKKKIANTDFSKPYSKSDLSKDIEELKEKIRLLEIKSGSRIDIQTENKEGIFPEGSFDDTKTSFISDEHLIETSKLLRTQIEDLDLSVRTYNTIKAIKIDLLADIVKYNTHELLKFKNFGKKTLEELEELLVERGLTFGMDLSKYNL